MGILVRSVFADDQTRNRENKTSAHTLSMRAVRQQLSPQLMSILCGGICSQSKLIFSLGTFSGIQMLHVSFPL